MENTNGKSTSSGVSVTTQQSLPKSASSGMLRGSQVELEFRKFKKKAHTQVVKIASSYTEKMRR
eukprot:scaffold670569_cov74-Prasinocladus_malaysianus.AAC.1